VLMSCASKSTYDEVAATRTMINRTEMAFGLKPARLAADTAYGTGKLLAWLLDREITPHIPVWDRYQRTDGMFSLCCHKETHLHRQKPQHWRSAGNSQRHFGRNASV
jgi:hypothetical protein